MRTPSNTFRSWPLLAVLVLGAGAVAAAGLWWVVNSFNPVADEWHCEQGKAPAVHRSGGSDCYPTGASLPDGWSWDPLGNRPMPYNCDKDGWTPIANLADDRECIPADMPVPDGWRRVEGSSTAG